MSQPMGGSNPLRNSDHSLHMYITEEIFNLRSQILRDSKEAGVPDELAERWLAIDNAFKNGS